MPSPKPGMVADWDTALLNLLQPPGGQIASGWANNQIPPSNWFNWWMNLVGTWTDYLNDFETHALTWTALQTFNAGITSAGPNILNGTTTLNNAWQVLGTVLQGVGGNRAIRSVLDPVNPQDAATKNYVDGAINFSPQVSGSCGSFTDASGIFVDVTNLSITFTTHGRWVLISLQPDTSTNPADWGLTSALADTQVFFRLLRDGVEIARWDLETPNAAVATIAVPATFQVWDHPTAAAHTYKLQASSGSATNVQVNNATLVCTEL